MVYRGIFSLVSVGFRTLSHHLILWWSFDWYRETNLHECMQMTMRNMKVTVLGDVPFNIHTHTHIFTIGCGYASSWSWFAKVEIYEKVGCKFDLPSDAELECSIKIKKL